MTDSDYKTYRFGNVIILLTLGVPLFIACLYGGSGKKIHSSNNLKVYNEYHFTEKENNSYDFKFNCNHCRKDFYFEDEYMYEFFQEYMYEFLQEDENDMKTLNISAPKSATIKATVEQDNKIIHSEKI